MSWPTALKVVNNSSAGTADSVGGDDWDQLSNAVNAHSVFEPYNYFIYKDGSNYKAKNGTTGKIDSTNTSFNTVISAAITAMSSGGLIILGPGDFSLTSALTITQNNLKIKGMGVDKTRILFNMGSTNAAFKVTGSVAASKNLTGNAAQFATTVVVGTVSPIVADDWIYLARNVQIDSGGSNAFDAEIHQVSSVTSTDIVLRDRIHAAYNTSATARVNKITWVTNFELEDLTMYDNRASVTSTTEGADTYFLFCKDLRINNVNFENGWFAAIGLQNCLDATLDNTYVRNPKILTGDSNKRNYGIVAYAATTNLTINGYHCEKARHAFTTICIDSVGQTYHAGRQRNIQLNNCIGFNSNVSDWDTHEGCVGITFNNCGAIGNDPTLGANTDSKAFTTRSPTIFNSCWSEGAFSICATVDHFTAAAGTTDIPGGNRTQFNSCHFSLPIVDGVHTNRGIQITANRAGVIINGCYFNNIPDYAIEIGDNCSDIVINNNIFDSCGGSNTSSEGIIHCLDDVTNLIVTNNDFSAGTVPANSRPLVVVDVVTGLTFAHNIVRGLTNTVISTGAGSTEIINSDNYVDLASIQTLSNKVLDSSCDISQVTPSILPSQGKKVGVWNAVDDDLVSSATGLLSGNLVSTMPTGSTLTRQITSSGTSIKLETGTTINTQVGHRSRAFTQRDLNPRLKVRWKLGQTTDCKVFIGFGDVDSTFLTGSNYMNVRNGFGLQYDSSTSTTNYGMIRNDGSGTGTTSSITCPVDVSTIHTVEISFDEVTATWTMDFDNGAFVETRSSTDIVASTTDLGIQVTIENLAGSNKSIEYYYLEIDMLE